MNTNEARNVFRLEKAIGRFRRKFKGRVTRFRDEISRPEYEIRYPWSTADPSKGTPRARAKRASMKEYRGAPRMAAIAAEGQEPDFYHHGLPWVLSEDKPTSAEESRGGNRGAKWRAIMQSAKRNGSKDGNLSVFLPFSLRDFMRKHGYRDTDFETTVADNMQRHEADVQDASKKVGTEIGGRGVYRRPVYFFHPEVHRRMLEHLESGAQRFGEGGDRSPTEERGDLYGVMNIDPETGTPWAEVVHYAPATEGQGATDVAGRRLSAEGQKEIEELKKKGLHIFHIGSIHSHPPGTEMRPSSPDFRINSTGNPWFLAGIHQTNSLRRPGTKPTTGKDFYAGTDMPMVLGSARELRAQTEEGGVLRDEEGNVAPTLMPYYRNNKVYLPNDYRYGAATTFWNGQGARVRTPFPEGVTGSARFSAMFDNPNIVGIDSNGYQHEMNFRPAGHYHTGLGRFDVGSQVQFIGPSGGRAVAPHLIGDPRMMEYEHDPRSEGYGETARTRWESGPLFGDNPMPVFNAGEPSFLDSNWRYRSRTVSVTPTSPAAQRTKQRAAEMRRVASEIQRPLREAVGEIQRPLREATGAIDTMRTGAARGVINPIEQRKEEMGKAMDSANRLEKAVHAARKSLPPMTRRAVARRMVQPTGAPTLTRQAGPIEVPVPLEAEDLARLQRRKNAHPIAREIEDAVRDLRDEPFHGRKRDMLMVPALTAGKWAINKLNQIFGGQQEKTAQKSYTTTQRAKRRLEKALIDSEPHADMLRRATEKVRKILDEKKGKKYFDVDSAHLHHAFRRFLSMYPEDALLRMGMSMASAGIGQNTQDDYDLIDALPFNINSRDIYPPDRSDRVGNYGSSAKTVMGGASGGGRPTAIDWIRRFIEPRTRTYGTKKVPRQFIYHGTRAYGPKDDFGYPTLDPRYLQTSSSYFGNGAYAHTLPFVGRTVRRASHIFGKIAVPGDAKFLYHDKDYGSDSRGRPLQGGLLEKITKYLDELCDDLDRPDQKGKFIEYIRMAMEKPPGHSMWGDATSEKYGGGQQDNDEYHDRYGWRGMTHLALRHAGEGHRALGGLPVPDKGNPWIQGHGITVDKNDDGTPKMRAPGWAVWKGIQLAFEALGASRPNKTFQEPNGEITNTGDQRGANYHAGLLLSALGFHGYKHFDMETKGSLMRLLSQSEPFKLAVMMPSSAHLSSNPKSVITERDAQNAKSVSIFPHAIVDMPEIQWPARVSGLEAQREGRASFRGLSRITPGSLQGYPFPEQDDLYGQGKYQHVKDSVVDRQTADDPKGVPGMYSDLRIYPRDASRPNGPKTLRFTSMLPPAAKLQRPNIPVEPEESMENKSLHRMKRALKKSSVDRYVREMRGDDKKPSEPVTTRRQFMIPAAATIAGIGASSYADFRNKEGAGEPAMPTSTPEPTRTAQPTPTMQPSSTSLPTQTPTPSPTKTATQTASPTAPTQSGVWSNRDLSNAPKEDKDYTKKLSELDREISEAAKIHHIDPAFLAALHGTETQAKNKRNNGQYEVPSYYIDKMRSNGGELIPHTSNGAYHGPFQMGFDAFIDAWQSAPKDVKVPDIIRELVKNNNTKDIREALLNNPMIAAHSSAAYLQRIRTEIKSKYMPALQKLAGHYGLTPQEAAVHLAILMYNKGPFHGQEEGMDPADRIRWYFDTKGGDDKNYAARARYNYTNFHNGSDNKFYQSLGDFFSVKRSLSPHMYRLQKAVAKNRSRPAKIWA